LQRKAKKEAKKIIKAINKLGDIVNYEDNSIDVYLENAQDMGFRNLYKEINLSIIYTNYRITENNLSEQHEYLIYLYRELKILFENRDIILKIMGSEDDLNIVVGYKEEKKKDD